MSMTEDLNWEGKWWLPDRDNEKFEGSLTFDHQLKRYVLSIISGLNFEISEMGNRAKTKHDIILGETSDGQKVTLKDCEQGERRGKLNEPRKYSINATYILLGEHFKRPEDIIFSSIYVTYHGVQINRWIERVYERRGFESTEKEISIKDIPRESVTVKINYSYNITVVAKPRVLPWFGGEVRQGSNKEVPCLEIGSLKEKSLDEYFKVNLVVLDFLNFIFPKEEVHIESIHGVRKNRKDLKENIPLGQQEDEVKIFYPYAISGMFKPMVISQPIFPRNESQRDSIQALFEKYMKKWFEMSNEIKPFFDLYFGIMYNPEMYIEFRFLGLAQALESYHRAFGKQTAPKWENEIKVINRLYPQIPKRCIEKIKECYNPNLRDRVRAVYEEYSEIADICLNFKDQECFSRKVTKTRNYYTHWSKGREEGVVYGDNLFLLTQDLQLLLQLCIMTQLGFTKEDMAQMYAIEELWKEAYITYHNLV